MFQCNYGACINLEDVCNGVPDCVDFSDELLPQCKTKLNVTEKMICGYVKIFTSKIICEERKIAVMIDTKVDFFHI